MWIQFNHVEPSLPATANRDVDLNEASSTLVQVNVNIFSTNSLQQLKKFPFRNFERDFFHLIFFNAFFWRKWTLGARPVGKMNTKFCLFMSRCSVFFFHFGTFLQEKSETNTFDWKHRLKSSGQELKRKSSLARFKVTLTIFSLYVSDFWMSSCREPTCPLFWLEQELHVEDEQVKYFKIHLVLLLSDQMQEATADTLFTMKQTGGGLLSCHLTVSIVMKKGLNG